MEKTNFELLIVLLGIMIPGIFAYPDAASALSATELRPNVLLITIDDLNTDVGFMGSNFARTPHMDALASQGTVFNSAHIPAPICNPARTSFLLGMYPHTTGIYGLNPYFWEVDEFHDLPSLPAHFRENGYFSAAVGKVYHGRPDERSFEKYAGWFDGFGPFPDEHIHLDMNINGHVHPYFDWGPFLELEETTDYRVAEAAVRLMQEGKERSEPFFLAVGFYRPHCPLYAPQEWFDLHPLEEIAGFADQSENLADVPPYALKLINYEKQQAVTRWKHENDLVPSFLQAYRASVSFVDFCVGIVLDALHDEGLDEDTIVVILSDHGVHNGDKNIWYKRTLWDASTRVPFVIKAPGRRPSLVQRPVGIIDLYPTLCELAGLPIPDHLEGRSLTALFHDGNAYHPPVIISHGPDNFAIVDDYWRYIRYADGSEELYNQRDDPQEKRNLAAGGVRNEHRDRINHMRREIPPDFAPFAPGSSGFWSDAFPGL